MYLTKFIGPLVRTDAINFEGREQSRASNVTLLRFIIAQNSGPQALVITYDFLILSIFQPA